MKKSEFETKLMIGITSRRLSILKENGNRNQFYSGEMYDPEYEKKIYLLELGDDYFILRSDLIFDNSVERFFYVTKEKYEFSEENLKYAIFVLQGVERKVYEILSKLRLRGFYSKRDFLHHLIDLMPQLEWTGNVIRERKNGTVFITIREDVLHLVYRDGKSENYMDLAKKDLNEQILKQCVEVITSSLRYEGI